MNAGKMREHIYISIKRKKNILCSTSNSHHLNLVFNFRSIKCNYLTQVINNIIIIINMQKKIN